MYYLPYFFIHYLIGLYTTLVGFNLTGIYPSELNPLESHTYYKAMRSGNIIKPIYYIGGISSFYLIDLGASI